MTDHAISLEHELKLLGVPETLDPNDFDGVLARTRERLKQEEALLEEAEAHLDELIREGRLRVSLEDTQPLGVSPLANAFVGAYE